MIHKKPRKIVQVTFQTSREYEDFHTFAVRFWGTDNHYSDAQYIKECIKQNVKLKPSSNKRRAVALVESQEAINTLLLKSTDSDISNLLTKHAKEEIALWVG